MVFNASYSEACIETVKTYEPVKGLASYADACIETAAESDAT